MKVLAVEQGWSVGYQDECWWSRLAQPDLHSWQGEAETLRLHQQETAAGDPQAKALCCYGLWLEHNQPAPASEPEQKQMLLRFVEGQPSSATTIAYLEWVTAQLAPAGHKMLVMVWDNASWHRSKLVRNWLKEHNQQARRLHQHGQKAVRIIPCYLPVQSPWLNNIEPCWIHGKRAVVEAERKLSGEELMQRVCAHFSCAKLPLIPKLVA